MNGHDHCAELIEGVTDDGVQYHTIGSAHYNDPSTAHASTVSADQLKFHTGSGLGGFASVTVDQNGMVVTHRDGSGKVLFEAPPISPRSTKALNEEAATKSTLRVPQLMVEEEVAR